MNTTRAFVDGSPADAAALVRFARSGYSHFTTMQVRDGAVRGLGLHLARLEEATRVLFDTALDVDAVRAQMRRALEGVADASLRVSVGAVNFTARCMEGVAQLEVLVLVDPPAPERVEPVRLMSVVHARYLPEIKHGGMFDLFHLRRRARGMEFDDVVLVTPEGLVAEGTTFNVGFFNGDGLVWPEAPRLEGVMMRLVSEAFEADEEPGHASSRHSGESGVFNSRIAGHPVFKGNKQELDSGFRRNDAEGGGGDREKKGARVIFRPVTLAEVAGFDGAFCCNTGGIWPIRSVDDHVLPNSQNAVQHLRDLLATLPSEPI